MGQLHARVAALAADVRQLSAAATSQGCACPSLGHIPGWCLLAEAAGG